MAVGDAYVFPGILTPFLSKATDYFSHMLLMHQNEYLWRKGLTKKSVSFYSLGIPKLSKDEVSKNEPSQETGSRQLADLNLVNHLEDPKLQALYQFSSGCEL